MLLKFADPFHETFDNEAFDVMFTFNRYMRAVGMVGVVMGVAWLLDL